MIARIRLGFENEGLEVIWIKDVNWFKILKCRVTFRIKIKDGTVDFVETDCRKNMMNDGRMTAAGPVFTVQPNHGWYFVPPWRDAFGPFSSKVEMAECWWKSSDRTG